MANGGQAILALAGVTVTAYDTSGTLINSTTTLADGTYTLSVPDGTEVRVEFTGIPVDLRPGTVGTDSATTVVFVTSPVDNVDMGLVRPEDYCQDDPYLASPCYFNGDPLLPGSDAGTADVLRTFPYSASGVKPGIANTSGNRCANWPYLGAGLPAQQPNVICRGADEAPCGFRPFGNRWDLCRGNRPGHRSTGQRADSSSWI